MFMFFPRVNDKRVCDCMGRSMGENTRGFLDADSDFHRLAGSTLIPAIARLAGHPDDLHLSN
jgi:hypothetical protein